MNTAEGSSVPYYDAIIDDDGITSYDFPDGFAGMAPTLSPDGRYIALRPGYMSDDLGIVVFSIDTREVANLPLLNPIVIYLRDLEQYAVTFPWRMTWRDENHLSIWYYPGGVPEPQHNLDIEISKNPLTLTALSSQDEFVSAMNVVGGSPYYELPSSSGGYTVELESVGFAYNLRVYDSAESVVYTDLSDDVMRVAGHPRWLDDDNTLFYIERERSDQYVPWQLVQVDASRGFLRVDDLNLLLQSEFGDSKILSDSWGLATSSDHRHITFQVTDPSSDQEYVMRYTPSTGEVIAVCSDLGMLDGNVSFGPNADYVVQNYYEHLAIYEFTTGNRYALDTAQFIGWAPTRVPNPLDLDAVCSSSPDSYRMWRVQNKTDAEVVFTWELLNTDQSGQATVPSGTVETPGEVIFQTERDGSIPNTVRILVDGIENDIANSIDEPCAESASGD